MAYEQDGPPGTWHQATPAAILLLAQSFFAQATIGPGTSLYDKINQIQDDIIANHYGLACEDIAAFANQVEAQTGKKITEDQAALILQIVALMESELSCGG
jgi:hypothetical protein